MTSEVNAHGVFIDPEVITLFANSRYMVKISVAGDADGFCFGYDIEHPIGHASASPAKGRSHGFSGHPSRESAIAAAKRFVHERMICMADNYQDLRAELSEVMNHVGFMQLSLFDEAAE